MDKKERLALRRRRLFFGLACALLGLAAPLLLLEWGVRLLHPYLPRDLKVVWIRSQLMKAHRLHRGHRELLWTPAPDLAIDYPNPRYRWHIRHAPFPNDPSAGYRADAPAPSPVDLVVLGDSYTYGFEVDQDKTWVELLKRTSGLSAVNLAVTSYGTSQEAAVYRLYGKAFKPRLVLQVIVPNDPLDNVFFNKINPSKDPRVINLCWFLGLRQPSLACSTSLWDMKNSVVGGLAVFQLQALAKRRGHDDPEMLEGTEMICDDVKSVRSLTRPGGVKYAAVLIGQWDKPRLRLLKRRLDDCLSDNGVPALQLDDVRESLRRGRRFTGRFDWHWNEEGHAYVASRIEAFLRELGWLRAASPGSGNKTP